MKFQFPNRAQFAFYGICVVAAAWILLTVVLETHFGFPNTPIQWAKRLVGWGVELWLIRSFLAGIRRTQFSLAK